MTVKRLDRPRDGRRRCQYCGQVLHVEGRHQWKVLMSQDTAGISTTLWLCSEVCAVLHFGRLVSWMRAPEGITERQAEWAMRPWWRKLVDWIRGKEAEAVPAPAAMADPVDIDRWRP